MIHLGTIWLRFQGECQTHICSWYGQHFIGTTCKVLYAFIVSLISLMIVCSIWVTSTECPLQWYMLLYSIYNPLVKLVGLFLDLFLCSFLQSLANWFSVSWLLVSSSPVGLIIIGTAFTGIVIFRYQLCPQTNPLIISSWFLSDFILLKAFPSGLVILVFLFPRYN